MFKPATDTIATKEQWQEHTAHRDNVLLEGVEIFNDYLILTERELGQTHFVVVDKQEERLTLEFDDPCYYAAIAMNPEPNTRCTYLLLKSNNTRFIV